MSAHRFYLPPEKCREATLLLGGAEAHHAAHVLRLRQDDAVTVLDGAGQECLCRVREVNAREVRLDVAERRAHPARACRLTLAQALPKGKLIEFIIQKATELGADRIVPLTTERVVSRLVGPEAAQRAAKWQRVAIEALKQCGSPFLPRVEEPVALPRFLAEGERFELSLVASLEADGRHPREWFREFEQAHGRRPGSVCVWVGPEGDFTPEELQEIRSAGALPISLGQRVLRAETAAVYCLSVVTYELEAPAGK